MQLNFPKVNVMQQEIAELLEKHRATKIEVGAVLRGMLNHEMVNEKNVLWHHYQHNKKLMDLEGAE